MNQSLVPHDLVAPGNVLSVSTIVATWLGWLPHIAAALSIIWFGVLLYDRVKYGPKR